MSEGWPHPPATPEPRRIVPQPAFVVRALGLVALAGGAGLGALLLLRTSLWLAPVALLAGATALLSAWGAAVQWVGGEKVDDHPWV